MPQDACHAKSSTKLLKLNNRIVLANIADSKRHDPDNSDTPLIAKAYYEPVINSIPPAHHWRDIHHSVNKDWSAVSAASSGLPEPVHSNSKSLSPATEHPGVDML